MVYQFLCWRVGRLGKRLYPCDVGKLFERLREANNGILPMYLSTWQDHLIFAGQSSIALPEREAAAKAVFPSNEMYPTLQWLKDQYTKLLQHVAVKQPELMVDPPVPVSPGEAKPITLKTESKPKQPQGEDFSKTLEKSVSNVTPKAEPKKEDGDKCSVSSPAILPPTSTSTDSPKTLSTATKPLPQTKQP